MKTPRAWNSTLPVATKPMKRTKPPRKVNRARKAREFTRCYHSRERVRFVQSLPCCFCAAFSSIIGEVTRGYSQNAHTVIDGMGRKGPYTAIVPLCHPHHKRYDEHLPPFDNDLVRGFVKGCAAIVERLWQGRQSTYEEINHDRINETL